MSTEQQDRGRHTPGPWTFEEGAGKPVGSRWDINSEEAKWGAVAECYANRLGARDISNGEAEANARLIAAAPELLAACKVAGQVIEYLRARLRGDDVERLDVEYHAPKIAAAIAKAEGGAS